MIKKYVSYGQYLVLFLPISLIFSNFISDFIISLLAMFGLFFFYLLESKEKKLLLFAVLWCLYLICLSVFKSDNVLLSLESSLFYVRFIFFTVFIYIFVKENTLKYLIYIFFICYIILFIDSIYQYIFHINLTGYPYDPNYKRITSFFGYEQILGSYIARTFPLIIGIFIFFNKINNRTSLFLISLITISIILVVFSGERLATFYLIISIITFGIISRGNKILSYYFLITFLSIVTLFFTYPSLFDRVVFETYYYITSPDTIFFSPGHTMHYITALEIFKDNIFFGIGPKLFREVCNYPEYSVFMGCSTHPHHIIFQILTEIGIFGFIPILYLLYKIFYNYFVKLYLSIVGRLHFSNLYEIMLLICIINHFNFLAPSGNFFNNILNIYLFMYISFYLRLNKRKNSK